MNGGEMLKRWREGKGLTADELANILGYKRRQIQRLESREKPLRRSIRLALAALDANLHPLSG